jgi:hypothetical protein
VAVLSLALGIGANSTIFSIVDGTFLRPWPVEGAGSLVSIFTATQKEPEDAASYPEYLDLNKQNTVFSGVLAYGKRGAFVSAAGQGELVLIDVVSENYFSVLGVKPMLGRTFLAGADQSADPPGVVISYELWQRRFGGDGAESPKVVLINQTLPRQFWPQGDAVGKWLQIGKEQFQVVGVVEVGKYLTIHEAAQPYLFFPFAQMFSGEASLFVETEGNPRGVMDAIMREARSVNDKVPIVDAITLKQHISSALFEDTAAAWLVGSLGLLGIFLASVGLYGVISYTVNRRTREIGIRMALGARSGDVMSLVLAQSLKLVLVGVLIGLGFALAASRVMAGILYGVKPTDPLAFIGGAALVVAISLLASSATFPRAAPPAWTRWMRCGTNKLTVQSNTRDKLQNNGA